MRPGDIVVTSPYGALYSTLTYHDQGIEGLDVRRAWIVSDTVMMCVVRIDDSDPMSMIQLVVTSDDVGWFRTHKW